jgi:hypothetical protein
VLGKYENKIYKEERSIPSHFQVFSNSSLSLGIKRPGLEADDSPSSSAEVNA